MRIVVALGGNALGDTPQEQLSLVKQTSESIVDLIEAGHDVVVVHGNGPQVGMIHKGFETGYKASLTPQMPLTECGAMSQGYIGYHLQNAIKNTMLARTLNKDVVSIVTQTIVDANDPAFSNPTKPIGSFYSYEEAKSLQESTGRNFIEDSGRGYRYVVASPKPTGIVEINTLRNLVEQGTCIVAGGGGGIPVVKERGAYKGVPAVIDKDSTSALIAELIKADVFIILTAVPRVAINFGKPNQQDIAKMSIEEAEEYIKEGQFPEGSMLPKVNAAINFVLKNKDSQAIIASLEEAANAIKGKTGTILYHS